MSVSVILLSGGTGSRMQSDIPKQYLLLNGKPIIQYSYEVFSQMPEVTEIVIVCAPQYQQYFASTNIPITFALPGERRQDSVYNGFKALKNKMGLICIHDGARPFVTQPIVRRVIEAAKEHGAATAGMPIKFTVKECNPQQMVSKTPDRTTVWEIQTPQVIDISLLEKGFVHAHQHNITVTDDVSLVELLQLPVKLVEGCYSNLKITTPEDLKTACSITN